MNNRYLKRNEDCYKASWIDLDYAMNKAFDKDVVDKNSIKDTKDLNMINKSNITLSEFEHIITKYSNYSLEQVLSTSFGLVKIPDYSTEDAGLSFDIDG